MRNSRQEEQRTTQNGRRRWAIALTVVALCAANGAIFGGDTEWTRHGQTVAFVRTVSLAALAYRTDNDECPPAEGVVDTESIARHVEPDYVATLPRNDAWGHPLRYWTENGDCWSASYGPDGESDSSAADRDDIVFKNGQRVGD